MSKLLLLAVLALIASVGFAKAGEQGCVRCYTESFTEHTEFSHPNKIKRVALVQGNWVNAATENHLLQGSGPQDRNRSFTRTICVDAYKS